MTSTAPQLLPYLERLLDGETVEWKTLGEVAELVRGNGLSKKDFSEYGVPAIHYGQIYTYYGNETEETLSFVSPTIAKKLQKVYPGNIVITNTSENVEDVCKAVLYSGNVEAVTGGHATIIRPKDYILPKYLVYYTLTLDFFTQKKRLAKGTKVIDVSAKDLAKIVLPLPPLRVQARIVDILDKFTQLEAELEAELEARKKQYAYYRDQLLKFSQYPPLNVNTEWKTLGEVAEYVRQRVAVDQLCAQTYVGVDNLLPNRAGKQDSNYLPTEGNAIAYQPNDILIGNIRPYLKKIWKADNEGGASGDVLVVRIKNSLLTPGYLYHLLADDRFFSYDMQHAKGAKMPRGNKEKILDYVIPLPPLSEQRRIVEILDRFDTLTNSISEGLPREIALRRKQYEYYRDALLRFPPPAPTA